MQCETTYRLDRRNMLKAIAAASVLGTLSSRIPAVHAFDAVGSVASSDPGASPCSGLACVTRPIVGTGWHGHTFPGATAPFGMVQLSPDTAGPPEAKWNTRWDIYGWDHCPGYHYPDNVIKGFSHTHLSGTGAKDLGDVLIMPVVEGRNWSWEAVAPGRQHAAQIAALGPDSGWVSRGGARGYSSSFSHQQEIARAGYYSVYLQTPQVKAELTATTRCGMHRYTYPALPAKTRRGVILDLVHGLGCTVYHAQLNIENATTISGKRYTHGWAADKQVYFVMELSHPILDAQIQVDGKTRTASVGESFAGTHIKAILSHAHSGKPLTIRVGISGTGVEGARRNLEKEIPVWDFDAVHEQTQNVWNKALSVIEAKFPDKQLTETFYTAAYHGMVAPATFNDVDGTYRGEDHKNHANPGFTNYTTMSIWDIYRGEFPFMMLMQPHRTNDVIKTLLADYRQLNQHSLPVWPLWGNETWCMSGFHVVAMILGAYVRGFRDYDVEAAYAAMRDTALAGCAFNGNKRTQEQFRRRGYVVSSNRKSAVSATLGLAYDYWCVGAMADILGKHSDAQMFYRFGQNYRNLFDPETGFMRGRTADGAWRKPFRPDREYWSDYTESDAWQETFNVKHDVQGLINLYGGDAPFIAKLDELFAAPSKTHNSPPDIAAMLGQDAQADEPSNHIPYLYNFAGAAWKTQHWVRRMLALYNNTPNGVPGNDDCGQTSSCFGMGALGFYPVNPGTGVYVIGSPLINRAKIRSFLTHADFTIIADNNSAENWYIQYARLNGRELTRSWLTHSDILAGGELYFRMGKKPNRQWASDRSDRPPSGLVVT